MVIHHRAYSQGDRGQTKYLSGGVGESTSFEYLLGCWALCLPITHEATGPSYEAGAIVTLHLQERKTDAQRSLKKKKIVSLEAPQQVSSKSWDANPSLSNSKACALSTSPFCQPKAKYSQMKGGGANNESLFYL